MKIPDYIKIIVSFIAGAILLSAASVHAAPISWDFANNVLQPLQSAWNAQIKGSFFTATSTTATSTFAVASSTKFCLSTDCRTVWPSSGSPGGASSTVQFNSNGAFAGNNGFVYTGSNVGIGTTTPTYPLTVVGNEYHSGGYFHFGTTTPVSQCNTAFGSGDCLEFVGNDNTVGGIGEYIDNINTGTSAYTGITLSNSLAGNATTNYSGIFLNGANYNDPTFGTLNQVPNLLQLGNSMGPVSIQSFAPTQAASYINFFAGSTTPGAGPSASGENMRITSSGVSIGTTSPTSIFTVSTSDSGTTLTNASAAMNSIINTNTTNNNFSDLAFGTADASGNTVVTSKIAGVNTVHTGAATSGDLAFLTRNGGTISEKMRLTAGGNLGIGATPTHTLDVNGNGTLAGYLRIGTSNLTPTNTTAGDLTATRLSLGNSGLGDANFGGDIADIRGNMTATSGTVFGVYVQPTINPATDSSADFRSLDMSALVNTTSNLTSAAPFGVRGGYFETRVQSAGNIAGLTGGQFIGASIPAVSTGVGNITEIDGAYFRGLSNASTTLANTITRNYGIYVADASKGGAPLTLTQNVGVAIEPIAAGTSNTALLIGNGSGSIPVGNFGIYNSSTNNNYFAGNIGIGTTTPASLLDVGGSGLVGMFGDNAGSQNSYIAFSSGGGVNGRAAVGYNAGNGNAFLQGVTGKGIEFDVNAGILSGTPAAVITSAGNFGIGTTSPAVDGNTGSRRYLTVSGESIGAGDTGEVSVGGNITSTTATAGVFSFYNGGITATEKRIALIAANTDGATNSGAMIFQTANAGTFGERLRITSTGNLGVGSSTPWGQLSVNPNGIAGPAFVIGSSTATNFIVTNSGNVGIGTTTPVAAFVSVAASTTVGTPNNGYTGTVSIIAGFENTVVKLFQVIDQWGHRITSGDTPSVSGGTSTVAGNDNNGTITVTGTLLTSVTLTFAHSWPSAPDCVISDSSTGITAGVTSISASQMVVGFSAGINSGTVWYSCSGHQ